MNHFYRQKGVALTFVMTFASIFLILLGSIISFILFQLRQNTQRIAWHESINIAEAGIDYYQWCQNHDVEACTGEKEYLDSAGQTLGAFSVDASSETNCGQTIQREVVSTGWTDEFSSTKRTIRVLYGRPSVGKYAFLLNDNVWAGSDRQIKGLYHSNGGIRMDGTNQSLVTSSQAEWVCTGSFGCNTCPTSAGCSLDNSQCMCPGVFGTTNNPNQGLFQYPVTSFDFTGITVDLAQVKIIAQANGSYFPPSVDLNSQGKGYHMILKANGTFDLWIVTGLTATQGYNNTEGWHNDYFIISSQSFSGNFNLNSHCGALFFEDNLWLEGIVQGKNTIVSANLIDANSDTDIILSNSITYADADNSDGIAAIGERNVMIPPNSPDTMTLKGIYIAQKGGFNRNHYENNIKQLLHVEGSIVSNKRTGTQWTSGSQIVSGYLQREDFIDPNLVYNAPPFVPYLSPEFQKIKWEEINP